MQLAFCPQPIAFRRWPFRMSIFSQIYSIGAVRSMLWRLWYPFVTRRLQGEGVVFLNYGFETDPALGLPLSAEKESDRACIQLYAHVAGQGVLRGKHVLEVSCGHGGGAAYLARTFRPATYSAMDVNPVGIRFCQERHAEQGLAFVRGDAEDLPFATESIDVVINIEASHCYGDFPRFLEEVARVLRPGGVFLYADFRFRDERAAWENTLAASALERVGSQVITADVVRGLDRNAQRSLDLVVRCLPKWMHSFGREFAGIPGSYIYRGLQRGDVVYLSYCFAKPAEKIRPDQAHKGVAVT